MGNAIIQTTQSDKSYTKNITETKTVEKCSTKEKEAKTLTQFILQSEEGLSTIDPEAEILEAAVTDITSEATEIANKLHNIIYNDNNKLEKIIEVIENEVDPVNISFVMDKYAKMSNGGDLKEDIRSISGIHFIKNYKLNKILDSQLHFENLDTNIDNEHWQGDVHDVTRNGSTFTITNKDTNETREVNLVTLLYEFKSNEDRKEIVNTMQELPAEVLMDISAEQTSFMKLEGKTVLDLGDGAECDAAAYYEPGEDKNAFKPNNNAPTIVHEIGHSLDHNYNNYYGENLSSVAQSKYFPDIFNEELQEYLDTGNKKYDYKENTDIKTYATATEQEMFAECYTLLMTGDCNSKKTIEKYFPKTLSYVKQLVEFNRSHADEIRH